MKDKNVCSVCDSKRQRDLIYLYTRSNGVYGSYIKIPIFKASDIQCTRCVLYNYDYFRKQWVQKHLDAGITDFYRFLPEQKTAVVAFVRKHKGSLLFPLPDFMVV